MSVNKIDKKDLKKAYYAGYSRCFNDHENPSFQSLKKDFEEWYNSLPIKPPEKWISIDTDLPPKDEDVLACFIGWDDMEFARVLEYDHDEKNWIDWRGEVYTMITHWKPINLPTDE